jgi:uncharacterized membrane protein YdfJ with MMPL/SSD domain
VDSLLSWLGVQTRQHRRVVLAAWLAIVAASVPFAMRASDHLTAGGFEVNGSRSEQVDEALARHFRGTTRANLAVLLWPRKGTTSSALTAAIERVKRHVHGMPDVTLSERDYSFALFGAGLIEPTVLPLTVAGNEDTAQRIAERLRSTLGINTESAPKHSGIEVHLLGEGALAAGLNHTFKAQLAQAETLALPILLVILLAVFGSLAAAAVPLFLGATAVVITTALIYFLSLGMGMSVFVTNTASMLGIGVAVDYSLIMLARVREELRAGRDEESARGVGVRHAGRAIIFSGTVVIGSLIGLLLVPSEALRSMAIGAMLVVAVSVLVTIILVPALIDLVGARRLATGFRAARRGSQHSDGSPPSRWYVWTRGVVRHRWVALGLSTVVLLLLCAPVFALHTRVGALRQLSDGNETRIGFAEAERLAGPGALGPAYVIVHARDASANITPETRRLRKIAAALREVKTVGAPTVNGTYSLFSVTPTVDPESPAAKRLVARLQTKLDAAVGAGDHVLVGGATATQVDEERAIAASMWKVIAVAAGMALMLLLVLFRSVVLAIQAVVTNLVSVVAAYGALVVVFQWGWLDSLFHFQSLGYVNTLTLPLVLAIVFALSMDYEVFFLTRIRERWLRTGNAESAVVDGIAGGAQTITSAAIILISVFGIFVATGIPSVKELGLGAAVAIAIDASLVRLVLVPAAMSLFGARSWWLPRPLTRVPARTHTPSATGANPT